MLALLTSSERPDLLNLTLESLMKEQRWLFDLRIHEDKANPETWLTSEMHKVCKANSQKFSFIELTEGLGQHRSIEKFLKEISEADEYYLHLEDDWQFANSYDWVGASKEIMEADPTIIKVLCRDGSPHPCQHTSVRYTKSGEKVPFGYLEPWKAPSGTVWHGFSWNPGVTRADLLKKFMPFPRWEQELAESIYNAGYKVVELGWPVYKHTGDGRSTHE